MNNTLLPVAILAGGLATRLKPISDKIPKSLVELNGEYFITHQLRLLKSQGFSKVILCLGHFGQQILDVVGTGKKFGLAVEYSFDGPKLLGTAGAIKIALPLLGENFFVLNGDSYLHCDVNAVQEKFLHSKKLALMTVFHNEGKWDTSNVEYVDEQIIKYDKKNHTPEMKHIDFGLGVFNHHAFDIVPDNQPFDLAELYQTLLSQQQVSAHEVYERFYEAGSFAGISELGYHLLKNKA